MVWPTPAVNPGRRSTLTVKIFVSYLSFQGSSFFKSVRFFGDPLDLDQSKKRMILKVGPVEIPRTTPAKHSDKIQYIIQREKVEKSSHTSMASSSALQSSSIPSPAICSKNHHCVLYRSCFSGRRTSKNRIALRVQAAKLPAGVETPKVLPKFEPPFLGFTRTAEIWNSRTCMIGLIGTFIVELILNKGILQVIGIDIGKGLDLPL